MKFDHRLEIAVTDLSAIETTLVDQDGRLMPKLILGSEVTLRPQFTSLRSSMSIGAAEILLFVLSIPASVVSSVAASCLYEWLKARRAERIRLNTRVILMEDKDATIKLLLEALDDKKK